MCVMEGLTRLCVGPAGNDGGTKIRGYVVGSVRMVSY